ncbi:hypothetical protein HPB51_026640 [Rhipicephalus microplus]|uniref:Uncharacterized protein n=1 Tax=Rhipicephalus microplus TaxID=6941 RepID=A0A9J6D2K0_RHIMP|nr:hypothetical protein HPB51_026640 [Rhipicephalus microplus]
MQVVHAMVSAHKKLRITWKVVITLLSRRDDSHGHHHPVRPHQRTAPDPPLGPLVSVAQAHAGETENGDLRSEKLAAEERQASLNHTDISKAVMVTYDRGVSPSSNPCPVETPLEVKQEKCTDAQRETPATELATVVLHDEQSVTDAISGNKKATPGLSSDTSEKVQGSKQESPASISDPFLKLEEAETKQVLLKTCVHAMKECLSGFQQHFKSVYYLARFYCHSKCSCNLQLARDYLMDSGLSRPTAAGLDFSTSHIWPVCRKEDHKFLYSIWHTPGDEIVPAACHAHVPFQSYCWVFQVFQKQGVFVDEAGAALAESYRLYKLGEVDPSPPIAQQDVMFCARRQHRESLRALEAAAYSFEQ